MFFSYLKMLLLLAGRWGPSIVLFGFWGLFRIRRTTSRSAFLTEERKGLASRWSRSCHWRANAKRTITRSSTIPLSKCYCSFKKTIWKHLSVYTQWFYAFGALWIRIVSFFCIGISSIYRIKYLRSYDDRIYCKLLLLFCLLFVPSCSCP